jgi:predicted enzyme related to lactoylglutathione lyase
MNSIQLKGEFMVTGIDVHLYNMKDFDRGLAFYRALLGSEPTTLMPGAWAEFDLADGSSFAIGKHDDHPWQPGYDIMFAVPDVAAAVELVRSLGGKAGEPSESPVCHMAFGEDSEGNQLVLHHRK